MIVLDGVGGGVADAGALDDGVEAGGTDPPATTGSDLPPLEGCPRVTVPAGPSCPDPPTGVTVLYDQVAQRANLAVDDDHIFLMIDGGLPGDSPVVRMDKCGADVQVLAEAGRHPGQMALSETHVAWTDFIGGGAVYAVPKAGGARIELAVADNPLAITMIGDDVLWGYHGIFRVPVLGGPAQTVSERTAVELIPREFDVFVSGVDHVGRLSLETGAWETLFDDILPDALEASCEALYWGDEFGNLVRGTLADRTIEVVAPAAYRLTRDEDWIYASNIDGEIWAVPVSGGVARLVAEGLSNPFYLAVDRTHIYWTRHSDGSVSAMPNPLR